MVNFNCMCGISLLKLFLMFAVTLQLFSALTEKEATAGANLLFMIQAETIKKEGYVAYFSVSYMYHLTPSPRTVRTIPRYLLSVTTAGRAAGLLCSASFMHL